MPTFAYKGRNKEGELITGKRLAQSADTLSIQLLSENIIPVSITSVVDKKNTWQDIKKLFQRNKITVEDLGIFARQMHTLSKTGVPITTSLRQLADNIRNIALSNALYGMVENLESGQDLAAAMQRYPDVFSPIIVSMVRVGQNTGRLDEAFLRLNQYLELEANALKKMKTATRYPLMVFLTLVVAIILINVFVIPTFARVFSQTNVPLPEMTVVLIKISKFFVDFWLYILGLIFLMSWCAYRYLHSLKGKMVFAKWQLRLPVIGRILQRTMLLRFAQAFSMVIHSGIPLLEGIDLVAKSIHNEYAKQKIMLMREAVEHGKNLTQAAANVELFTALELQMLSVSEETGELDVMFEQIALYYRRELEYDLKRLSELIEPLMIVMLSGIVLLLALAVYMPIWNMVKFVHG